MKIKVMELVKNWDLWPRYESQILDMTNVRKLKDAIRAGTKIHPIVIDKASKQIIDGFHRCQAYLSLFGEEAEIEVEARTFKDEKEMFLEAVRLNAKHGLPLGPQDRTHVILMARRKKVPLEVIGEILGMTKEKMDQYRKRRTATTQSGEIRCLPAGALSLAGKKLTSKEEHFVKHSNGMLPIINARLLLNALKATAYPVTEKEMVVLLELRDEIDKFILRYDAKKAM